MSYATLNEHISQCNVVEMQGVCNEYFAKTMTVCSTLSVWMNSRRWLVLQKWVEKCPLM